MRLRIVAVGRDRSGPTADLTRHYRQRLAPTPPGLTEIEARRPFPTAMAAEAKAFRAALQPLRQAGKPHRLVALDRQGRALDSAALAASLRQWRDQGVSETVFLIGGADGMAPDLLADCDMQLSLGPMTWPHRLARAMLLEQLYRARQINAGHPYHRA